MTVKQLDLQKALELAAKGTEILIMTPCGPDSGWEDYIPDTLQNMLEGCLFFQQEPAAEAPAFHEDLPEAATPPPTGKEAC